MRCVTSPGDSLPRRLVWIAAVALLAACTGAGRDAAIDAARPDIVVIVADDLGWNDVGYHGSEIGTPSIDGLVRAGVELDRFYTMGICSPTRMGLMTGRFPIRWGMQHIVVRPQSRLGLPREETTLAEMLGAAGYGERAAVGKWHLGHAERAYHPIERGFTSFYGSYNGYVDYYTHRRLGERDWHRGFETASDEDGEYVTELIAREATAIVEAHIADAEPLFLYVAFQSPHFPYQAPERYLAANAAIADERRRVHAAKVNALDEAVGEILAAIDRAQASSSTLVWFLSDNGADPKHGGANSPLCGRKHSVNEGGLRVPAAVRWPDGGVSGGRKVESLVGVTDVFPTLATAAGASLDESVEYDGRNVLGVLRGETPAAPRAWFAQVVDTAGGGHAAAVIDGEWKLIRTGTAARRAGAGGSGRELYRVRSDPAEATELGDEHPEIVERLDAKLDRFLDLGPGERQMDGDQGPGRWKPPQNWTMR